MFDNWFKKKEVEPLKVYALNARVGSKVILDTSHLIIANDIQFRSDLPTDYNVLAISDFELGGVKVNDINIYNDEFDVELLIRVFNDNDIVIYEQIDQINLYEDIDVWLDEKFGKFFIDTININDVDYDRQWSYSSQLGISYSYFAEEDEITKGIYYIDNLTLFGREVAEIGNEYIYLTNEEGEINVYIGVDFNSNAITVN